MGSKQKGEAVNITSVLTPPDWSHNSEFCFLSCQQSSQMVMHFKMNLLCNCSYQQIGPVQCSLQPWEGWPTALYSLFRFGFVCDTGPPRRIGLLFRLYRIYQVLIQVCCLLNQQQISTKVTLKLGHYLDHSVS